MDGDLCIEKILDAFDREYERSKAEHIDYFLSERKSLEIPFTTHKEICSTSGSEDSGYTKQALEECLAAYKIRGCASASVVRYRQRLKMRPEVFGKEDGDMGVAGGGVKRRLTRRSRMVNPSVRLTSAPAIRNPKIILQPIQIKTSVSLNDMPNKVLGYLTPPSTPPTIERFARHRKRRELPLKLEPVHFSNPKL